MDHGKISKEIAEGLLELQGRIRASNIPSSRLDETLNIATWNIRDFGKRRRSEAAIHYIAEILGQFDVISVVELRDDLTDLSAVLRILGPYWRALYSDAMPDYGGNHERIAFIYDKRAATFNGLAAEANAPRKKMGTEYLPEQSWWRSPYMASFKAGSFDFLIFAVHIRWGTSDEGREKELASIADWLDDKRKEKCCEDQDILVVGDFNITCRGDRFYEAITSKGLKLPAALVDDRFATDLNKKKRYDQILCYNVFEGSYTREAGVLDFFKGDAQGLFKGLSKEDFTYQMSDHLPLWMQINTDTEGCKLTQLIQG